MALTKLNNKSASDGILTDVDINTGTLAGTHILGYSTVSSAWINGDPSVWSIPNLSQTVSNITWASGTKALTITKANASFGTLTLTDVAIENSDATFDNLVVNDIHVDNGTNDILRADADLNKVQVFSDLYVDGIVTATTFRQVDTGTNAFTLAPNGRITTGENLVVNGNLTSTGIDDNATVEVLDINDSRFHVVLDNTSAGEGILLTNPNSTAGTGIALNYELPNLSLGDAFLDLRSGGTHCDFALGTGSVSGQITGITQNTSGTITFATLGSERMLINSSGTVKVGGTGSGSLQLNGASSGIEGGQLDIKCTGTQGTYSIDAYQDDLRFLNGTTSGNMQFYKNSNSGVGVVFTGTGRLGVGTASPSYVCDIVGSGDARLRIRTSGTTSSDDAIVSIQTANDSARSIVVFGDSSDQDAGRIIYKHSNNEMDFYTNTQNDMRLTSGGDLHVDGNVIAYSTTISDERLKDDVQDITGALDTVDALRGVTYTWTAGSREGKRDYGVIAQEVEQVIPEIVHDTTMPLINGDEETVYKTVDYEKLCAVLINAVSELRAEVEALKNGN